MATHRRPWLGALVSLFGRNWITLLGSVLSGVSALLIVGFTLLGLMQTGASPYLGIMALLVMPGVFIFGLLLVHAGLLGNASVRGVEAARNRRSPRVSTRVGMGRGRSRSSSRSQYPVVRGTQWRAVRTHDDALAQCNGLAWSHCSVGHESRAGRVTLAWLE